MKKIFFPVVAVIAIISGCSKSDTDNGTAAFQTAENNGISDFVSRIALPGYAELQAKATVLNNDIIALNASPTEPNLATCKTAWRDLRSTWEKCEGFLFGPVEDDNYDPDTDTWPVDYLAMNNLLANMSHTFDQADIASLPQSLKGYHPIEYILWGQTGTRTAASLTAREKAYITGLSTNLLSKATALNNSWLTSGGNYSTVFLNAGKGSTVFVKKRDAYTAIATAMSDICGEVGEGKMKDPYDLMDPSKVESPFSGNSVADFKSNITGAYNVYLGRFNDDGVGLEDLVKLKNSALDAEIQAKFNAAITSFNTITVPYEQAIISQRSQCLGVMNSIAALADVIDNKLQPFIIQYITD